MPRVCIVRYRKEIEIWDLWNIMEKIYWRKKSHSKVRLNEHVLALSHMKMRLRTRMRGTQ